MSAAVLREAARLMRERAEGLPGPWKCYGDHLVWPPEAGPAANDPVAGVGPDHEGAAEHIASWHPAVALAVADWLEESAEDEQYQLAPQSTFDAALAVARTYLGSDQ